MFINRIVLETTDIERLRYWYMKYFAMTSSALIEDVCGKSGYILSNESGNCELVIARGRHRETQISFSLGTKEGVYFLTELLRTDGMKIDGEMSQDAAGTYYSTVRDPDGNLILLTQ